MTNEEIKEAFCLACCEERPHRATCMSLGTCDAYDRFIQLLTSPWHKVSEELPKEDDVYYVAGVGFYDKANWCKGKWRNFPAPITHWMPIPELPKED